MDDGSNDPETVAILGELSAHCRIMKQTRDKIAKLGGLYRNMQLALDDFKGDGLFIFTQDDCQFVRDVTEEDARYFQDYFARFPDAAFLNPHFLKGVRKRGILRAISLHEDFPVYFYDFSERLKDRSVTMYFTDICVGHAGRLKAKGYRYQSNESTSGIEARRHFSKMGTMAHPFMMSLPQVPIYRGKAKTWAVSRAEKLLGTAPKSFVPWTEAETRAFLERDLKELPFAEDFLKCVGAPPKIPFVKESVNAFPMLRLIHKLELKWRKAFKR